MTIQDRIRKHGGLAAVHTTPVTDEAYKVIGWQNILVCLDGHREYPTLAEEQSLIDGPVIPKGFQA